MGNVSKTGPEPRTEISTAWADETWDAFVERHPWCQFQQATGWAQAKQAEGWSAIRLCWKRDTQVLGGAQVLLRATRWGRVAFVNKGPLLDPDWLEGPAAAALALTRIQRAERWRVLLLQPPDDGESLEPHLRSAGFGEQTLLRTIASTLVVDLTDGWDLVRSRFRRTARRNLRQASERGVTLVDGGEGDLPDFFRLMVATCDARGVRPNPPNPEALRALWTPFRARDRARLWFAVHDGVRIAGGLAIAFGSRVWFWKKGWDQSQPRLFANLLVTHDGIRWAAERGYRSFDFVSLDRDIAEALLAGREPGPELLQRRDFFNLGFGGQPRLLPPCLCRWSNPLLRAGYAAATKGPWRRLVQASARRLGIS